MPPKSIGLEKSAIETESFPTHYELTKLYACLERHGPKGAGSFKEMLASLEKDTPSMNMIRVLIEDSNIELYLTGGILRDAAVGKEAKDYDWVIRVSEEVENPDQYFKEIFARPELEGVRKVKKERNKQGQIIETEKIYNKYGTLVLVGERFGVYKFRGKDGVEHDLAFPRSEEATASGVGGRSDFAAQINPHKPVVGPDGELSRRDFDFNAMALKIGLATDGNFEYEFYDEFGGLESLFVKRELRCVGEARERFREDMSRMLRACRQAAKLGIPLSKEVAAAIREYAPHINDLRPDGRRVVSEQIASNEFLKGLYHAPGELLQNLYETGLLRELVPWFNKPQEFIARRRQGNLKDLKQEFQDTDFNTPQTQEIRRRAFAEALTAINFGREHFGAREWGAKESLLSLYLHLARCAQLEKTLPDGSKAYPDAHLLAQLMLNTDRYKLLLPPGTDKPELREKYAVDYWPLKSRLGNWPAALGLLSSEKPGPQEIATMLEIFPNLEKDALWKTLYAVVQTSPNADTGRKRLPAAEAALLEIHGSTEQIEQLTEELIGTEVLREQLQFLPEKKTYGHQIGKLKTQARELVRRRCGGEGICDPVQLKAEFFWKHLINEGLVRKYWQKHFHLDRLAAELFPETEAQKVQRAALRTIEQRVCQEFVGVPYSRLPTLLENLPKDLESQQLEAKAGGEGLSEMLVARLQQSPDAAGQLFKYLKDKDQRRYFDFVWPEITQIIGVPQDARYHREGPVDKHTQLVLEELHQVTGAHGRLPTREEILAALLHDTGKAETIEKHPDGRITFYGHEKNSAAAVRECAERFGWEDSLDVELVGRVVRDHMKPFQMARARGAELKDVLELFPLGSEDPLFYLLSADMAASDTSDPEARQADVVMLKEIESALPVVDMWRKANFTWEVLAESPRLGIFAQDAGDGRFRKAVLGELQALVSERVLDETVDLEELLWEKLMLKHNFAVQRYVAAKILPTRQVRVALTNAGVSERQIGPGIGRINRAAVEVTRSGQLTAANAALWLKAQVEQVAAAWSR